MYSYSPVKAESVHPCWEETLLDSSSLPQHKTPFQVLSLGDPLFLHLSLLCSFPSISETHPSSFNA